jgi:hypothetical protein
VGVAGQKEPEELHLSLLVDALVGLGEKAPAAIEGIGLVATMSHGLVLDPPPALIELGGGEFHHMKWII